MKRIVFGIMVTLLLANVLTSALDIQQVKAFYLSSRVVKVSQPRERHIDMSFSMPQAKSAPSHKYKPDSDETTMFVRQAKSFLNNLFPSEDMK